MIEVDSALIEAERYYSTWLNSQEIYFRLPDLTGSPPGVFDYQAEHEQNEAYQKNNWLLEYNDVIGAINVETIMEIGCGNGLFAREASASFKTVIAVDSAKSPLLTLLPDNCSFLHCDFTSIDLPLVDMVVSADVLEHLPPRKLKDAIFKLGDAAPKQFHVIACYDNRRNHLSVMRPGCWLTLFREYSTNFDIYDISFRRDRISDVVCAITNIPELLQKK